MSMDDMFYLSSETSLRGEGSKEDEPVYTTFPPNIPKEKAAALEKATQLRAKAGILSRRKKIPLSVVEDSLAAIRREHGPEAEEQALEEMLKDVAS